MKRLWPAVLVLLPRVATAGEVHTAINDVRACVVNDGHVTLATSGGVAILSTDGKLERVLTALDGLPDGRAHALHGNWIGTERGAALLENGKIARVVGNAPVRAIASVGADTYFGTIDKGVQKLTANGVADVPFAAAGNPLRARVFSLVNHGNTLVAGTAAGTLKLDGGKLAALTGTTPTFALASFGDRLYFGGLEGLSSIGNGIVRHESDADVRALAAFDGGLFAATYGSGVLRVGKTTTLSDLKFATTVNRGCIGTSDGVAVSSDKKTWSMHARDGLPSPDVAAIAVDGPRVYVGTFDRGLAVIEDGKAKRIADAAIDPQINALAVDKGTLWIATARGLTRGKNGVFRRFTEVDGLPSNDVHTVMALASGGVLVGTSKGAAIVRESVAPLGKKQGVTGDAVWAVAEKNGELWLGTNAGLFIGKPGGKFRRMSKLTGELPDDWVTAIAMDGDTTYVGTYAGGVVQIASGKTTTLGGSSINAGGLRVIDGKLWVATMEGLFVRDENKLRRVQNGVLGLDVTAIEKSSKGLVVATRRGLTIGLVS